jgi:HSP20 family protein
MNLLKRFRKEDGARDLSRRGGDGMSRLRREFEDVFERTWRAFERDPWSALSRMAPWPPIDIEESDAAVTLRVDAPGLEAQDLDVHVSGNQLTIHGRRQEERGREGAPGRHERYVGEFTRTMTLPSYADGDKIEARYEKGVLILTLPKIPGKGPKRVEVKAG